MISDQRPNEKHRIDDDLTRIPPVYRIQRNWLSLNLESLKGYRFFRVKSGGQDEGSRESSHEKEEPCILFNLIVINLKN